MNYFIFLNSSKFYELNLNQKKEWFLSAVKYIQFSQAVHFYFFNDSFNKYFQTVQKNIEILQFDSILGDFVLELRCGSESQDPSVLLGFIQQKIFYYQELNKHINEICNYVNDLNGYFNTFQKLNDKIVTLQNNFFKLFKKKYIQRLIQDFEKQKIKPPVRNFSFETIVPEYYSGLEKNILEQIIFIDENFSSTINKGFSYYPKTFIFFELHQSFVKEAIELMTYWRDQLIFSIEIGYYNFESFDFYYFKENDN